MKTRKNQTLFTFMAHLIALLQKNGQYRTMQHYKATLRSYKRFRAGKDISIKEIDAEEMQSYEASFLVGDSSNKHSDTQVEKKEEQRLYHNVEARITYHLKKLGAKMGIKGKLTLYVARHSWATTARDKNIAISVISEALGHNSETTTQIYLHSIQTSEVDDANAKILASL